MKDDIQSLTAHAFTVPTDSPESDGTIEWSSTTLVLVEVNAQGTAGWGYTYAHECCVPLIRKTLLPLVVGKDPFSIGKLWREMNAGVRNFGRNGIAASAIAAVEIALWDLKARLLNLPLFKLLGAARERIAVYGSGGFTSYSNRRLQQQLARWTAEGISMVKMKVGRKPEADQKRVQAARRAIGKKCGLFVDANGAYTRKQALAFAERFASENVTWFEEPVTSDDLEGLRFLCGRSPGTMEIAAGEYNYDAWQARRMLEARAVDVLQADATRCGVTGFLEAARLCETFNIPLSAHTAPALHAHLGCAATPARHVEYFHDHVRMERMFFEGATVGHQHGFLVPAPSEPGLGLRPKKKCMQLYQVKI